MLNVLHKKKGYCKYRDSAEPEYKIQEGERYKCRRSKKIKTNKKDTKERKAKQTIT